MKLVNDDKSKPHKIFDYIYVWDIDSMVYKNNAWVLFKYIN